MTKVKVRFVNEYVWHDLRKNSEDTPDRYNMKRAIVQIVEDTGNVWEPQIAEYYPHKHDWYCEKANGFVGGNGGFFKVIAWCNLPIWEEK